MNTLCRNKREDNVPRAQTRCLLELGPGRPPPRGPPPISRPAGPWGSWGGGRGHTTDRGQVRLLSLVLRWKWGRTREALVTDQRCLLAMDVVGSGGSVWAGGLLSKGPDVAPVSGG